MLFVVPLIMQAVITKRHIADGEIKEVIRELGILVTGNLNVGVGYSLRAIRPLMLSSSTPVSWLFAMLSGSIPKKLPTPTGRLQNLPFSNRT